MAPPEVALGIPWLLLELSAVVIALHGVAAVCTEFVFQTEGFVFGLFYTFAQCLTFAVLALAKCAIRGIPTLHVSALRGSAIAGLAMTVSHGCGILSYIYINYTTAMVFKSAKVPSVLLGARWINKAALTARELFWALCMMSGLLLFALGDGLESARFTVLGLVFIAVNLAGSTLTANLQQSVLQPSASVAPSVHGLMLVQYATASVVLFLQTSITGECSDAVRWYLRNRSAAFYTCLDNVLTYLGLEAVMCITKEFDATRANVVCSGRKAITFVFSYFFFPKPFSMLHLFGLVLTILGGWSLQQAKWHEKKTAAVEDELSNAASVDKVQEVTEQLAEFLVKFSSDEQYAILTPFLSMLDTGDEFVEPHIDEARKFICHYLAVFSQCERDLILEKWRPAFDTASLNSATESLTPSVTPPGSVTPTVVTPREFLSARREVNEVYHSHSPCGEAERS
ncbi:Slc35b3 [Symbiodinium sp. CCMP2592]|nr:Slc35b3 [Symbiodinium sp. CCMP2592]